MNYSTNLAANVDLEEDVCCVVCDLPHHWPKKHLREGEERGERTSWLLVLVTRVLPLGGKKVVKKLYMMLYNWT